MKKIKGLKCPNCGKKTLSFCTNNMWSKWKDYNNVYCRSCNSKYKIKEKLEEKK